MSQSVFVCLAEVVYVTYLSAIALEISIQFGIFSAETSIGATCHDAANADV
jgi:hypothetical protein